MPLAVTILMALIQNSPEWAPATPSNVQHELKVSCKKGTIVASFNESPNNKNNGFELKLNGSPLPKKDIVRVRGEFKGRTLESIFVRKCGVGRSFDPVVVLQFGRASSNRVKLGAFLELHFTGTKLIDVVQ